MDITIQNGDSLPDIKRCTDCCSFFHCPFCSPKSFLPTLKSKVKIHLKAHSNRAVQHAGYTIHRCGRTCRPMPHFHCPYCTSTVLRKEDFLKHVEICNRESNFDAIVQDPSAADDTSEANITTQSSENDSPEKQPNNKPNHLEDCNIENKSDTTGNEPPSTDGTTESNITPPGFENGSPEKEIKPTTKQRQQCPECHLTFYKKNLEKHMKCRHSTIGKENSAFRNYQWNSANNSESEGVPEQNMDITIQRGDSLPEIKKCTDCCNYFHCPFCSPKSFLPAKECRVRVHLKVHFNRAVQFADYTIHRCGRICRNQPHYHCPFCKITVLRREDFQRHLENCPEAKAAVPTAQDTSTANETSMSMSNITTPDSKSPEEREKCPRCSLTLYKKNLPKHIERMHTAREKDDSASPQKRQLSQSIDNEDGAQEESVDITIQQGDCVPEITQCTDCCSNFHCPFCSPTSFRPTRKSRVQFHLKTHFNRSVRYAGYTIHRCGRVCRNQPHFHCPFCKSTVLRKNDFLLHLGACKSKDPAVESLIAADGTPEQIIATPRKSNCNKRPLVRQKCPNCHLAFYKRNLKRHIQRSHSLDNPVSSSNLKSECVDPQNGVYAVHRIIRGVSRPIHVQIKMQGEEQYVSCDFSLCQSKMELAQKTGVKTYKCTHLQSVSNCRTFLSSPSLTERTLTEVVKRRLFRKSKVKMCIDRQIQAMQQNAPLSVLSEIGVPPFKKFVSVFEPNISHFSRLHRVMVSYNPQKNMWYCPCSRTKRCCTHKYIAKWHLFQKDPGMFPKGSSRTKTGFPKAKRPKSRSRKVQKPEIAFAVAEQPQQEFVRVEPEVQSDAEDTAMEILETIATAMETNVSVVTYPPKEVQMIQNMVHYLLVNKKLPSVPPEHLALPSLEKDYPQHLVPAETYCLFCADAIALSQPILITHKAKILTSSRAIQDISTYYKFCPRCGVPYRYQEWGDGLHNFNDHLLLDLPLCLSIRNMLQAHNGFGQIVEYLKSSVGAAFPSADTLLGAYLHFEALTDHQHQYSCVTWGDRPPVVVMELQSKAFNLSGRDLAGPAAALNGPGDMDHLWKALTEERIARGLVSSTKKSVLYKIL